MNSPSSAHPTNSSENIPLFDDPIVAEVRQARKEILDSFGGDYKAMLRDVRRRQEERKCKYPDAPNVVPPPPPLEDADR